ncbi:MAG: hypothetical protein ABMB14_38460 [Myxococcota bacterium]
MARSGVALVLLLTGGSVAHATPAGPPPDRELVFPNGLADPFQTGGPRDTAIVLLDRRADLPGPPVIGPDGATIEVTSYLLQGTDGLGWRVLVPTAPLEPGAYAVQVSTGDHPFTVRDELAAEVAPPGKVRRSTASECGGVSTLTYRACGGGVLHLAALGDEPPPEPTLDDPGSATVVGYGEFDLPLATLFQVEPGWTGTVWLGDLDAAGRFTGWWAGDPVALPEPGTIRIETPSDTLPSSGTSTPIGVSICAVFTEWEVLVEQDCTGTELVTEIAGCGCRAIPGATGPAGAATTSAAGAALVALGVVSRRRPRSGTGRPRRP